MYNTNNTQSLTLQTHTSQYIALCKIHQYIIHYTIRQYIAIYSDDAQYMYSTLKQCYDFHLKNQNL